MGQSPVREQVSSVALMLEQSPFAYVTSLVSGIIYVAISWTHVEHRWLELWLVALFAILFGRLAFTSYIQKQNDQYWQAHLSGIRNFLRVGAALGAVLWGMTAFLMNVSSLEHFASTIFIVAGLAAGGAAAYCVDLPTLAAFMTFMLIPFVTRLSLDPAEHMRRLPVLTLFYAVMLFIIALNIRRQKMKSVFLNIENEKLIHKLSTASHEIRAPVTAIVGFAEILNEQTGLPDGVRHFVEVIHRNSTYLRKLVDNVLLMSALEAKPPEPDLQVVDTEAPLKMVADLFDRAIRAKGLKFNCVVEPSAHGRVYMDVLRVQQILINLVGNSVKFTEKGEISVRAFRGVDNCLIFRVEDTGIGIDTKSGEKVFEPFWRERRLECRGKEGSGLGLSLSRSLTESMNGHLELVDSRPGVGSVFELRLPLRWA